MTLIIKELIIKGTVTSDYSSESTSFTETEALRRSLEEMKNELKRDCYESILRKLETRTIR